jgi:uncharacterized protein YndB with AHSA1/START domain
MSKKIKVSSKKAVQKSSAGKPVKKVSSPVSKKSAGKPAPKTAASKKPIAKATAKPLAKSKKPVAAAKKSPAKPVAKAKASPAKSTSSAKKTVSKSTSSPAKAAASKPAAKPSPAKKTAKAITKPASAAKKAASPAPAAPIKKVTASPAPASNGKNHESPKKVAVEMRSDAVLAINNTIPVTPKHEISPSKIASISQSITNPIRRNDSYAVKVEKEPAGKFELEFVFHASAEMLYEFVSTASGLSEWFCDDLNIRNGIYTFIWDDQLQQARLLKTIDLQLVRFQWVEKTDGSYFEFRIQRDDLTNDIALIVTDFADSNSEKESSKLLWNSQIEKLRHVLGSIF